MFSKANDVDKEGKNFSCWNWISRVLYTIRYAIYLVQTSAKSTFRYLRRMHTFLWHRSTRALFVAFYATVLFHNEAKSAQSSVSGNPVYMIKTYFFNNPSLWL